MYSVQENVIPPRNAQNPGLYYLQHRPHPTCKTEFILDLIHMAAVQDFIMDDLPGMEFSKDITLAKSKLAMILNSPNFTCAMLYARDPVFPLDAANSFLRQQEDMRNNFMSDMYNTNHPVWTYTGEKVATVSNSSTLRQQEVTYNYIKEEWSYPNDLFSIIQVRNLIPTIIYMMIQEYLIEKIKVENTNIGFPMLIAESWGAAKLETSTANVTCTRNIFPQIILSLPQEQLMIFQIMNKFLHSWQLNKDVSSGYRALTETFGDNFEELLAKFESTMFYGTSFNTELFRVMFLNYASNREELGDYKDMLFPFPFDIKTENIIDSGVHGAVKTEDGIRKLWQEKFNNYISKMPHAVTTLLMLDNSQCKEAGLYLEVKHPIPAGIATYTSYDHSIPILFSTANSFVTQASVLRDFVATVELITDVITFWKSIGEKPKCDITLMAMAQDWNTLMSKQVVLIPSFQTLYSSIQTVSTPCAETTLPASSKINIINVGGNSFSVDKATGEAKLLGEIVREVKANVYGKSARTKSTYTKSHGVFGRYFSYTRGDGSQRPDHGADPVGRPVAGM